MTGLQEALSSGDRTLIGGAKQPYLERLVINVSHDCNLRCTYCYADTGAYGSGRMTLSEPIGREIVDDFFARFARIGKIQFFGGEPFLNVRGVESLCQYVTEVCQCQGVPVPAFTAISNGTIVNDRIIDLINRYNLLVTVSLDGSRAVNDSHRVYANGKGSYQRVIENIRRMKERTGQPLQIEGTYTARHVEMRFSLAEFMRFIAGELDVHSLHMPWIVGHAYQGTGIDPTEENIAHVTAVYCEAASASLMSLQTPQLEDTILLSAAERFLRRERSGDGNKRRHICPAGSGTLSVGADGKISPCFMFTNNAQFEFGRVGRREDDEFEHRRSTFMKRLEIPEGENGRSFEIGAACAGQNFELSGQIDHVTAANRQIQIALDAHLENEIARIKADQDLWEWMQTKLLLNQMQMSREIITTTGC